MNLLRIQDALKNASDQQLMQLMQAPDSTAPSYLVLSEIRRRKDMRAKQAPEGQSNRTVAEDLTAPEDQGIRGMQMPEEPPQDVSDQSGIEAMREGGVVRMQAGGRSPFVSAIPPGDEFGATEYPFTTGGDDPIIFGRPLSSYSRDELERLMPGASRVLRSQGRGAAVGSAGAVRRFDEETGQTIVPGGGVVEQRLATLRARTEQPLPEPEPVRGDSRDPIPRFAEPDAVRGPELAALLPPASQQQGQQGQQGQGQGQQGQGQPGQQGGGQPRPAGGGGGGAPAGAGATEAGLPTMADIYRQNQGLFADGIGALRERAQQERVDPAARRSEAVNMALIEAGLRIAGSRNPSLVGAIGEGALPAVQSYGQQLGQIRAEQREARRDELELAKQELNRQFAVGQISATEFRTRMDNVNANLRAASAERAASIRAGASEAAADRRATASEAAADRRASAALELERVRAQNRPIDLTGIPSLISTTATQIRNVQGELSLLGGEPPREIRGRPNPEHQRWSALTSQLNDLNTEMAEYRRMIRSGLPTRGATSQTGAGGQGSGISQFGG